MLVDLIKKSFKTIINSPVITLFFVLYLILFNFAIYFIQVIKFPIILYIYLICLFLLSCGFIAGWLNIIKESTDFDAMKDKKYLPIFFEGITKYIAPISIGSIAYILILISIIVLASYIATLIFGNLESIFKDAILATNSLDFINNLSDDKKYMLYGWQLCFIIAGGIFNYLFLFYFPTIIYDNKNNIFLKPIYAIYSTICFTFRNFLQTIALYLLIYLTCIILNKINVLVFKNDILQLIMLLIFIYFIPLVIMLIFNYYEKKTICNNGSNSIGENETINTISKND